MARASAKDRYSAGYIWDSNENVVRYGLNERGRFREYLKAVLQRVRENLERFLSKSIK